jgi:hypothetical protein
LGLKTQCSIFDKMKIKLILLLLLYTSAIQAQRILAYDSISTAQQDYPCVVQTLDDGSLLMASITRPWLLNGKGDLILVRVDINGNPVRYKTITLDDISINIVGGVYKTGDNQYSIFCVFDTTTPNFNNRPTHFGFIQTDTLFNLISVNYSIVNFRSQILNSSIFDIKVKPWRNGKYFGTLGVTDTGILTPYIVNVVFDLNQHALQHHWDTVHNISVYGRVIKITEAQRNSMDFEWVYDDYLLSFRRNGFLKYSTTLNVFSIKDSIWTGLYMNGVLPIVDTSMTTNKHFIDISFRGNLRHYKDSLLLVAGTGRYVCEPEYCIDTLYQYNPGQSGIAIIPLKQHNLRNFSNFPLRFAFVEDIRTAFYEPISPFSMSRLFIDPKYSSAFMQSLDYYDENKIYFGRQMGDIVNIQRIYNPTPSCLLISQFDSTLNKTWELRIPTRNREGIVSVNATHDGGVILTTRSSVGQMNDPQFPDPVHLFDIAVYKINAQGVMTSLNKIKFNNPTQQTYTLYPNPAKDYVKINGDSPIHAVQVWDSQGKQYHTIFNTTTQDINTSHLPVGIYYIQLFNSQNEILQVIKLVKE